MMSNLELDHIFVFCGPQLNEAQIASENGFRLSSGNQHPEQGTSNRCIFFNDDYLELIYLNSLEEAKINALRLDIRADWTATGASPFGIALRGEISKQDLEKFWDYTPSYMQGKIIKVLNAPASQPLIFVVPNFIKPHERVGMDQSLFLHSNGTRNATAIEIFGPNYSWPLMPINKLKLFNNETPLISIQVDGSLAKELNLGPVTKLN